jgi:quinol monooxygenase YgiN
VHPLVQVTVRLTAASGRTNQLAQALQVLMREALHSDGCVGAHLAADSGDANEFWYSEDWEDGDALERELRTDRFSQLLALMETSAVPPTIEFRVVTETRGLEYVAAVRGSASQDL